jgi:dCTP deaminase
MILSDKRIRELINEGEIVITPELEDIQYQPSSIDLRLGHHFARLNPHTDDEYEFINVSNSYELLPNEFILGTTMETIQLPDNIAARVEGRSSIGRKFLTIHSTAGFIDPGFKGQITLEINNANFLRPFQLISGMKIAQLVFEELDGPCDRPYGHKDLNSKYQNQTGATPSRLE